MRDSDELNDRLASIESALATLVQQQSDDRKPFSRFVVTPAKNLYYGALSSGFYSLLAYLYYLALPYARKYPPLFILLGVFGAFYTWGIWNAYKAISDIRAAYIRAKLSGERYVLALVGNIVAISGILSQFAIWNERKYLPDPGLQVGAADACWLALVAYLLLRYRRLLARDGIQPGGLLQTIKLARIDWGRVAHRPKPMTRFSRSSASAKLRAKARRASANIAPTRRGNY